MTIPSFNLVFYLENCLFNDFAPFKDRINSVELSLKSHPLWVTLHKKFDPEIIVAGYWTVRKAGHHPTIFGQPLIVCDHRSIVYDRRSKVCGHHSTACNHLNIIEQIHHNIEQGHHSTGCGHHNKGRGHHSTERGHHNTGQDLLNLTPLGRDHHSHGVRGRGHPSPGARGHGLRCLGVQGPIHQQGRK